MSKRATCEGSNYSVTRDLRAEREWLLGQLTLPGSDRHRENLEVRLEEVSKRVALRERLPSREVQS